MWTDEHDDVQHHRHGEKNNTTLISGAFESPIYKFKFNSSSIVAVTALLLGCM
jgi:hypothetical protein